jgi:phosphatidylglycerol:prolipoprotein diacylglycerol transferase
MYPKLFGVEWLNTYGLCMGLGIVAALVLFWLLAKKINNMPDKAYNFYSWVALVAIGVGIFSAWGFQQLYSAIEAAREGFKYTVDASFTFMGGLVGGAVTFIAVTWIAGKPEQKREFYKVVNYAAPCIAAAHALGRIGCFLAGCCYGKPSEFGIDFPYGDSDGKVIPIQLYEALFLFVLLAVMLVLILKFKKLNFMIILYAACYAVFRFVIEYYRGDDTARGGTSLGLYPSQWQSIALFLIAAALAICVFVFKKIPFYKPLKENAEAGQAAESPAGNSEADASVPSGGEKDGKEKTDAGAKDESDDFYKRD